MALQLFDTMSRRLQPVEPLEPGHVRVYTCGPTVYARAHIGNFRTFMFEDVLRRWLERRFARVTHVMNLTDVEDKIIRNALAGGHTLDEETAPHIAGFFEDLDALGIRRAHQYPRATEHIEAMVELIDRLTERGVTYESEGNVYFRIAAFPSYGRLSGIRADGLVAGGGGRVDADEYAKEDVRDFALWKRAGPEEPGWDSVLGRGRPGWHIECSAMSMALLGESFDIHCGGVDNIFPHHENEIAQSEAATGRRFVSIWCHSAHLRIGGEKMAKSAGNFATLHDLIAEGGGAPGGEPHGAGATAAVRPSVVRYLLAATAHYRKPLTFAEDVLHMSAESVDRLAAFRDRIAALAGEVASTDGLGEEVERGASAGGPAADRETGSDGELRVIARRGLTAFGAAMDDDLNLPGAMGAAFTAIRDANRVLDGGGVGAGGRAALEGFVSAVDDVVGVLALVDGERAGGAGVEERRLLDARAAARAAREWAESDRLREELRHRGIAVEDTPRGQRWRRER